MWAATAQRPPHQNERPAQAAGRPPSPTRHPPGVQQPQPWSQHQAMRMQSEDNDQLLNASGFCGLMSSAPRSVAGPNRQGESRASLGQSMKLAANAGTNRCVQCGVQTVEGSSFDHTCPKCGVVVCHNCVDDFRLIIPSYRCPHCGDEHANQALLTRTAWSRNMFRSARSICRTFSDTWTVLFASEEGGCAPAQLHGNGVCASAGCFDSKASSGTHQHLPTREPQPQRRTPAQPPQQAPYNPRNAAYGAAGAQAVGTAAAEPEHRTRLPAGWGEGAGLQGQSILRQMRGEDAFHTLVPPQ